jgi:PAT family beta-lactamase induction signal transducer AmpG
LNQYGWKVFLVILVLAFLYKLTDAFALSLSSVFFLRILDYTLVQVGVVNKLVGIIAGILGGLLAGLAMTKMRLFTALVIFGLIQAFANLIFVWLYLGPHTVAHLGVAVFIDNFASGLGSTAFLAWLISLCNKEFAATQYALLSAITALGRVYMGPAAAWTVDSLGWVMFFIIAVAIGVIATALLLVIRKQMD